VQDGPKQSGFHLEFIRWRQAQVRLVKPALAVVVATVPIGPGDDVIVVAAIQIDGGGKFLEIVEVGHLAARFLALLKTGNNSAERMPMMPMTTSSSIKVNPESARSIGINRFFHKVMLQGLFFTTELI